MMTVVIVAILAPLLLLALGYAIGLQRLMRLELVNPAITRLEDDSVDTATEAMFSHTHAWLLAQDFQLAAHLQMSPGIVAAVSRPRAARYYLSADRLVVALLTNNPQPENGKACSLLFASRHASGTTLVTTNRSQQSSLPLGPHFRQQDGYADSDDAQYRLHRQTLEGFHAQPCDDIADAIARSRDNNEATLDFWQQSGWIRRNTSSYRLTLKGAWTLLRRASQHNRHLRTLPPMQAQDSAANLVGSQEDFIRNVLVMTQPGTSGGRWPTVLLFLATLGLFAVLGKFQWSISIMLILLAVLLIHELGHFLAMRASGYRDLSIFFLPLIGAATSGRHDNASSRQKLLVALAGPVPGILLALVLLLTLAGGGFHLSESLHHSLMMTFIIMLLVINYLNLLPVTPFDGGRVMEILFFSRFPRANFLFYALCTAVFGLAWLYSRDYVLLFLVVVLALGLPGQWRVARAARLLRPEFGQHPQQDDAIHALATAFTHTSLKSLPVKQRSLLVLPLLARLQQEVTPWRVTLAGSAVYAALLALPVAFLLLALKAGITLPGTSALFAKHAAQAVQDERKEMEAKAASARTPLEKMKAYTDLANYLMDIDDGDGDELYRYASLAYASITPELDHSAEAADARMVYADALGMQDEPEKMRAVYVEAYDKLKAGHPDDHERLGNLLQRQESLLPGSASAEQRVALLQQAHDHFLQNDNLFGRFSTGERLALLWHQQGRHADAEAMLRQLLSHGDDDRAADYWRGRIRTALGWLLLDTGRTADSVAIQLQVPDRKFFYDNSPRALAWAQLQDGHADAARETLRVAFKAREDDAKQPYNHTYIAFFLVDDVLIYRKEGNAKGAQEAQQRLRDFITQHKLNGRALMGSATYATGEWAHSLADAEKQLLQEMGYSANDNCDPDSKTGNDNSGQGKAGKVPLTST